MKKCSRRGWERPIKTWWKTLKHDLDYNDLTEHIIIDGDGWWAKIYKPQWD